jgi:hypothetical protein
MTEWTRYLGSGAITIRQIVISFSLGLLATPAYFFGVLPFDVNGQPVPLKGIESGSAAVALWLAVCQFLVAWRSCREADEDAAAATGMFTFTAGERPRETSIRLPGWSLMLAMLMPVAGMYCLMWLNPHAHPLFGWQGANNRIRMGVIGMGGRSARVFDSLTRQPNLQLAAFEHENSSG